MKHPQLAGPEAARRPGSAAETGVNLEGAKAGESELVDEAFF